MSIDMQSSYSNTSTRDGSITLCRISECEWRVSDASIPDADAGSVLGFVECVGERMYEVLELGYGHGISRLSCSSLDEVLAHFARRDRIRLGATDPPPRR